MTHEHWLAIIALAFCTGISLLIQARAFFTLNVMFCSSFGFGAWYLWFIMPSMAVMLAFGAFFFLVSAVIVLDMSSLIGGLADARAEQELDRIYRKAAAREAAKK
jgi:ABC-type uncharacterized transport system YnjBCD permease subunit